MLLCCVLLLQESKARLSAHPGFIPHLVGLLQPGCGEQLQCGVLRLLHNLSFDAALRQQMMAAGLVRARIMADGRRAWRWVRADDQMSYIDGAGDE